MDYDKNELDSESVKDIADALKAYFEGLKKPYCYDQREIPAVRDFEGKAAERIIFLIAMLLEEKAHVNAVYRQLLGLAVAHGIRKMDPIGEEDRIKAKKQLKIEDWGMK